MKIDGQKFSDFLSGIRKIEPESLIEVFNFLRQQQYNKLRGAKGSEELLAIQMQIKSLDSIQENFISWREKGLDKQ